MYMVSQKLGGIRENQYQFHLWLKQGHSRVHFHSRNKFNKFSKYKFNKSNQLN